MDKTLLKKLTEKNTANYASLPLERDNDYFATLRQEQKILKSLATDLLQPRTEAIANILKLAKTL